MNCINLFPQRRAQAVAFLAACLLMMLSVSTPVLPAGPEFPRSVIGVAFSPDGKHLAASSGLTKERGTVHLLDLNTRKLVWKYESPKGIPSAAFSPDGRTLAVALYDLAARLLDAATGKELATFKHPAEVRGVAFSPEGKLLATACWDGCARIWDLTGGGEKALLGGPKLSLRGVHFTPDGSHLLVNGGSIQVKLWSLADNKEKLILKNGTYSPAAAQLTPDAAWLLTGDNAGRVRLWDMKTGLVRVTFTRFGGVYGLAYSAHAQQFAASGAGSYTIQLRDLPLRESTKKEQDQIAGLLAKFDDDSYDVREAASGEMLKIGFIAETQLSKAMKEASSVEVRIRARTAKEKILSEKNALLEGHTEQVQCVAYSPDGKLLASGASDGTVRLWDVASGKETGKWSVD